MTASSPIDSTVDLTSPGPVSWSAIEVRAQREIDSPDRFLIRLAPLRHGIRVRRENEPPDRFLIHLSAVPPGERPQALLTMRYRATDHRRRRGAPMVNLANSASFHSCEKITPSNPKIKHLNIWFRCDQMVMLPLAT